MLQKKGFIIMHPFEEFWVRLLENSWINSPQTWHGDLASSVDDLTILWSAGQKSRSQWPLMQKSLIDLLLFAVISGHAYLI